MRAGLRNGGAILAAAIFLALWTVSCREGPDTGEETAVSPARVDPATQVQIGGIVWYTDYDLALSVARRSGKPLWLHFGENPG